MKLLMGLLLTLIFMMLPSLGQAAACPPDLNLWPKVLGAFINDSYAHSLDIKAGKIAVSLSTTDPLIVSHLTIDMAMVVQLYSVATSELIWSTYVSIKDWAGGIALNNEASLVAMHSYSLNGVLLFNSSDGAILR
jgi:hypothetical protein